MLMHRISSLNGNVDHQTDNINDTPPSSVASQAPAHHLFRRRHLGADERPCLTTKHDVQQYQSSHYLSQIIEILSLLIAPIALIASAIHQFHITAALSALIAGMTVLIFIVRFDRSQPALHHLMPLIALVSVAVAGRMLFMGLPSFKPMLAISIIAGICLNKQSGFMVGCLCMLISNMMFGQGPWTPWQMYAMGLAGYMSGLCFPHHMPTSLAGRVVVVLWGGFWALIYGLLLDSYHVIWFVQPLQLEPALAAYAAGVPFNLVHAWATMLFLAILALPWSQQLQRIARKYGLHASQQFHEHTSSTS